MIPVFDFCVLVLASGAVTDCLLNGSIFELPRAVWAAKADATVTEVSDDELFEAVSSNETSQLGEWLYNWTPTFFAKAWTCSYCLQFHVAALILLLYGLSYLWPVFFMPLLWFACVRTGFIVNSLLPRTDRYERSDIAEPTTDEYDTTDDAADHGAGAITD